MFNNSNGFTMPVAPISYGNNGGFGGFGDDWLALIVILALFGGYGNGGFGFGGGFGGGRGCVEPCATKADLTAQGIVQKLDGITYGISDATFALSNSINNGFHGVDNAICNLGYQTQSGFNGLSAQLASCCCDTQRAIDGVNYNMATQACDIKHAINDSTRSILDFLTTDKIATLQAENQALKFKASQSEQNAFITANQQAQTAELIRRLGADCPIPAYVVPNPNCCYNPQVTFGYNNGCGCA
jgi:hypothetical protein